MDSSTEHNLVVKSTDLEVGSHFLKWRHYCVCDLVKLQTVSVPQLHSDANNSAYPIELLKHLNEITYINHLAWYVAHSKHWINWLNVNYYQQQQQRRLAVTNGYWGQRRVGRIWKCRKREEGHLERLSSEGWREQRLGSRNSQNIFTGLYQEQ